MTAEKNVIKPKIQFGYDYEVISCPTAERLQKALMENRNRPAFYPYMLPVGERGVWLVVATENPKAAEQRKKPKIIQGLKPISEAESRKLIPEMTVCTVNSNMYNDVDTFLIKLYDAGYQVCEKIDTEVKP